MKSAEVVQKAVESVGAKKVAAAMNVSASLVYKWCEGQGEAGADEASGALNPLDRVAALWDCTGDTQLLDWLCRRAGGSFIPDPFRDKDIDTEYVERTQRLIRDFSELLTSLSQSMIDDGRVNSGEAEAIRRHWQTLKQHAESFVLACEKGLYDDRPRVGPGRKNTV